MIDSQETKAEGGFMASSSNRAANGEGRVPSRGTEKPANPGKGNAPKEKSDFGVRFASSVVYVLLVAACVFLGNVTTALFLAFVAGCCAYEFYGMMKKDNKLVNTWLGVIAAAGFPLTVYFLDILGVMVVISVFMLALITWYVFWPKARIIDLSLTVFGAAYMGMPLSFLLAIRMDVGDFWGAIVLLALLLTVWANDVGAYLVGRQFGKHKLAPVISPKKTWEGFFGGLVLSVVVWCLMTQIPVLDLSLLQALAFGVICGSMGVVGDLAESRIKRNVGVKDSGRIMPGHGGLFDRNDALLLVSVSATVLLYLGGCIPNGIF